MEQTTGNTAVNWSIRPYREGDIPALVVLANAMSSASGDDPQLTEADLQRMYYAGGSDPTRQAVVVDGPLPPDLPPGTLIGSGRFSVITNDEDGTLTYRLSFRLHPTLLHLHMEDAIAAELFRRIDAEEARRLADAPSGESKKVIAQAITFDSNKQGMVLWESLGLQSAHAYYLMHRSSADPIEDPRPVEGVEIHNYLRPDNNDAVLRAAQSAFVDAFDFNLAYFTEQWQDWDNRPTLRPELSWVAEDAAAPGNIVAFSIVDVGSEKNPKTGELQALISYVGTLREWRGKGLARNLLLRCLLSLRDAGINDVLLSVDATSLTGANRLYESVGFSPKQVAYQYECALSDVKR